MKRPLAVLSPTAKGVQAIMSEAAALILRAAGFAAAKHRNQHRKDADQTPYVNHVISVARLLADEGGIQDPRILAAALLHDTLEDTETTAQELAAHFGQEIASIVQEVTDDKSLPASERKRLQVEHAGASSQQAKVIKIADKTCNLRDLNNSPPVDWSVDRKRQYFDWAKRVVDEMRGTSDVLERLFDEEYGRRP